MHVRWRGLELPAKVNIDPQSRSGTFARFVAEPFERGFGITVGNSLRRILLSSLEGAAIYKVTIKSQGKRITHEFSTIPGVLEDVADILLNIKGLIVSMDGEGEATLRLAAEGPGDVTAELIEGDSSVLIHNPEKLIATLTDAVDFECEFTVKKGRGYEPASEQYHRDTEQVIGEIPIDAIFSPVQRVRYACEDTRVGQRTNYQKLILDVWTNGTLSPEMAVVEAAKIMRKHLNPFVQFDVPGDATVDAEVVGKAGADEEFFRRLSQPITALNLSVRSSNCLESAKINSIAELVQRTEDDLLGVRAFGKTSLREVKDALEAHGLSLGMQLPEGFIPAE
jgi:DNA-directed RNA polymerase subunit alpha